MSHIATLIPSQKADMPDKNQACRTAEFLQLIGVPNLPARTSPFDPGYDPATVISHLEQSHHFISSLKISMACWMIANETATREKVSCARRLGVPVCTGGGPFEIAVAFGKLPEFLDLCADIGVTHIEAGAGFTEMNLKPEQVVRLATERGLGVQFEVGKKHGGTFTSDVVEELLAQGQEWLDAGAQKIVVEGRESALDVGLFDERGKLQPGFAEKFVETFGMEKAIFEAPNKSSQFALLNHFGPEVHLSNIRIEELLRVEIYRRGLHSDAFEHENLKPKGPRA